MPTAQESRTATPVSEQLSREKLIETAREGWISRLIDLSRRNNLLYYKPSLSGTLELALADPLLNVLMSGRPVPISALLGEDVQKLSRVKDIARKALENLEEKGLTTLYLAL